MKTLKQIIAEANDVKPTKPHPYHVSDEHRKMISSVFSDTDAHRRLHPKSKKPDGGPYHYPRDVFAHHDNGKTTYNFKSEHGKLTAHAFHYKSKADHDDPKKGYDSHTKHVITSRADLEKMKKQHE